MTLDCPICKKPAMKECKCPLLHRTCENKHMWFTCSDCGQIQTLLKPVPHKSFEATLCVACLEKPIQVA